MRVRALKNANNMCNLFNMTSYKSYLDVTKV